MGTRTVAYIFLFVFSIYLIFHTSEIREVNKNESIVYTTLYKCIANGQQTVHSLATSPHAAN